MAYHVGEQDHVFHRRAIVPVVGGCAARGAVGPVWLLGPVGVLPVLEAHHLAVAQRVDERGVEDKRLHLGLTVARAQDAHVTNVVVGVGALNDKLKPVVATSGELEVHLDVARRNAACGHHI